MMVSAAYFMIRGAHRGGAREGDLGDALAGPQGLAGFQAEAVDHVERAGGQEIADQIHQHQDRGRGLLGRLENHAVARRQGGRQLPGRHQEGEVPGDDLADHAQGFVEMVGDGVTVNLADAALLGADATREIAEMVNDQRDVRVQRLPHGLAVVPGLGDRQHLQIGLDAVGNLEKDVGTGRDRSGPPGVLGPMGRIEGQFDVLRGGAGNPTKRLAVDRGDVIEIGTADRRHPLTADEVVVTRAEVDDGACRVRGCVSHWNCPRSASLLLPMRPGPRGSTPVPIGILTRLRRFPPSLAVTHWRD
jgi:hypothetical protein